MAVLMTKNQVEFFGVYKEYAGHLRTWLVGYGVGLPALILSNKNFYDLLNASGTLRCVAISLACGLFPQVLLAAINKYVNWVCYWGELDEANKNSKIYEWFGVVSNWIYIDMAFDFLSIGFYIISSFLIFRNLIPWDAHGHPASPIPTHNRPIDFLLSLPSDHRIPWGQKKRDHIAVIPSYNWWVGRDSNSRPTD